MTQSKEDKLHINKIELPLFNTNWLFRKWGDAGVFFGVPLSDDCKPDNILDAQKTPFEKLWVKQPTWSDPTCFLACRLKQGWSKSSCLHDSYEYIVRRNNMKDNIHGLTIYDLSSLYSIDEEEEHYYVPEASCEVNESALLAMYPKIENWVG